MPWVVQVNLDFHQWRECRSTNDKPVLWNSSKVHLMILQLESIYIQRITQEIQIVTMDEHPGNNQGQQLRGRRGVRMYGGRVQRQNRGRGRRGQGQRRISDKIRATIVDHVVNHGLTMAEAGRRVQPNIGTLTVSSIIQTFRRENRCQPMCNVLLYCLLTVMIHNTVSICILQHTANILYTDTNCNT